MFSLTLGQERYDLDTTAISAVRYRAAYGASVLQHLEESGSEQDRARVLLRLCHTMIPPDKRPGLRDFAVQARREETFPSQAWTAADELLRADPDTPLPGEEGRGFDEYDLLAAMSLAGLGFQLLYELPLFHLGAVLHRRGELQQAADPANHKLSDEEFAGLFGISL